MVSGKAPLMLKLSVNCGLCRSFATLWSWFGRSYIGRVGTRFMVYSVKEVFKTLQGEGGQTGRAAVFCRFAGCNLWSGREQDRAEAACRFCDTDFVGLDGTLGGRYATADVLAAT